MNKETQFEVELFEALMAVPDAGHRRKLIDAACASKPALRQRIQDLLAAADDAGCFMDQPAVDFTDETIASLPEEKLGTTIGRYKLLEKIGEGGFGTVYMADQLRPIERRVALKIIKLGMDTKQVIARFEAERQALALMDHPNIAKILDAGTTDKGRPYFVMELVRGIPVTEYCDDRNLTTEARLKLFCQVCAAVQHAHQKGIIHRDIKPSNILVSTNGDDAVPKVIDFGIAKATQGRLTDKTLFTQFRQFIGTPAYMSPEQAQMSAVDIDTRSDIYSLGVLLYELLTGKTPLDADSLVNAGYDEICRRIREEEAIKPSRRLSSLHEEELTTLASRRNSAPAKFTSRVRGDLDWIVMKAVDKDRSRRYESCGALVADVERFLNDEPVSASPPTFRYRAAKFVRRYKRQVGAAAAFAVLLCLSSIIAWTLYMDARLARDAARLSEGDALSAKLDVEEQKEAVQRNLVLAQQREREAELLTDEVQRQLRIANVRQLAAQSQALKFESPIVSTLLAAKSVQISRNYPKDTQALAFESLVSALCSLGGDPMIKGATPVTCMAADSRGSWIAAGHLDGSISICTEGRNSGPASKTIVGAHQKRIIGIGATAGRIVSASEDGYIRGWDIGTDRTPKLTMEIPCQTRSLCVSADGRWMAAGDHERQIHVWDLFQDEKEPVKKLGGHPNNVHVLRFTPDGKRIVAGVHHEHPTIHVWDVETANEINVLRGHEHWTPRFVTDPKGHRIASASWDGTVRLWDIDTGSKEVNGLTLIETGKAFEGLAISPDGRWLAAGCDDHTIHVWDLKNSDPIITHEILYGHTDEIWKLAFTSDSKRLISGSDDKTARAWAIEEGGRCHPLAVLRGHEGKVRFIEVLPNGVATGSKDGTLRRWDLLPHNLAGTYPNVPNRSSKGYDPYYVIDVAYSADGQWLATADQRGIRIWPADNINSEPKVLLGHRKYVESLAFEPLGRYLFSAGVDGTVRRWDLNAPETKNTTIIKLSGKSALSVLVSADSRYILVRDSIHEISLYRHTSDKTTLVDSVQVDGLSGFVVHPDATRIYTASETGDLIEWSIVDQKIDRVGSIDALDARITAIALARQGSLLAVGCDSGQTYLYEILDGKARKLAELAGSSSVSDLVLSADASWLYAGEQDRILLGWDLEHLNGSPALLMRGHHFATIDVSRDGTRLVSGGRNDVPQIWSLKTADLLQLARTKAGRKLIVAELSRFNVLATESDEKNRTTEDSVLP